MIIKRVSLPLKITDQISQKHIILLIQLRIIRTPANFNPKHSFLNIDAIIDRDGKQSHLVPMLQP